MPVIEIKQFVKYFGEVKAVDGISFAVEQGEIFGFLGPNGAGKTTTIRAMMDFIRPTSGGILLSGKDSKEQGVDLKKDIGYLSGNVRLYGNWTGRQHIEFSRQLNGSRDISDQLIQRMGFSPQVKAKYLSSGNRQKLGIILAFMFEPKILILDEPTNALDPILQNTIYELMREQTMKGATVFMSSHNLAEVERVCTRVGIIRAGKMVALEDMESLKAKQMYNIKVAFTGIYSKGDFITLGGVSILGETDDMLVLSVKGEMAPVLRALSSYRLKNLEIGRASLEDIFLEYYE